MSAEDEEEQPKQPLPAEMIDLEPKYGVAMHEALDAHSALVRDVEAVALLLFLL